jgi:hypothetical protein
MCEGPEERIDCVRQHGKTNAGSGQESRKEKGTGK